MDEKAGRRYHSKSHMEESVCGDPAGLRGVPLPPCECPYLPGRVAAHEVVSARPQWHRYETLLAWGWRRSGDILYRCTSENCGMCIPIRVPCGWKADSRSARRLERVNSDLTARTVPSGYSEEHRLLYADYCGARHGSAEDETSPQAYSGFLLGGQGAIVEYRDRTGKLCGAGWIDILRDGISSVFFAFAPDESRRSLGRHSVSVETGLCRSLGKSWYYLGFWVPGAARMDYKADFTPFELALRPAAGEGAPLWIRFSCREEALEALAGMPRCGIPAVERKSGCPAATPPRLRR